MFVSIYGIAHAFRITLKWWFSFCLPFFFVFLLELKLKYLEKKLKYTKPQVSIKSQLVCRYPILAHKQALRLGRASLLILVKAHCFMASESNELFAAL